MTLANLRVQPIRNLVPFVLTKGTKGAYGLVTSSNLTVRTYFFCCFECCEKVIRIWRSWNWKCLVLSVSMWLSTLSLTPSRGIASDPQLPTTIVDGNKDPNSACQECGHESIQVNNDESKSIGLTVFAMLECYNCTTRMADSFTSRKMKGSETF